MPFSSAPFPAQDAIVSESRRPTRVFIDWVTALIEDVDAAPYRYSPVRKTGQAAAIATTSIAGSVLSSGLYRVSYFLRVTQAATTSSSVQVTLGFTNGGVACVFTAAAVTGNTIQTVQSESKLVYIDAASPVTFSTAYSSSGATAMQYEITVVLEAVNA